MKGTSLIFRRIKGFVIARPESLWIIIAELLLALAALLAVLGSGSIAENVGNLVFFALFGGICVQIGIAMLHRKEGSGTHSNLS